MSTTQTLPTLALAGAVGGSGRRGWPQSLLAHRNMTATLALPNPAPAAAVAAAGRKPAQPSQARGA